MGGVRRVRLVSTSDQWTSLQPGDAGTVTYVDSLGTVHVRWDCPTSLEASTLGLIPGIDQWEEL